MGQSKENKRHKSNILKKEQSRVKSFGLMGLPLQYQSFCQHWKIFHLKLLLFGKNKKMGERDGKKGEKRDFFF